MTDRPDNVDCKKDTGPPEANVPGNELHDLIDSWEWMHDAAEPKPTREGEYDELAEMYQMAVCHCIADLRRVLSRHE